MDPDERDSTARTFGVSIDQGERDHLISHILAFLSREFGDRIHFIGGTALARTHLTDGRLSEDIDLVAIGIRNQVAGDLDAALPHAVARTHGRLAVTPTLRQTADTLPVLLQPEVGRSVRLQLLSARERVVWPTESSDLFQRYTDAPAATLLVPTRPAFAAAKTATWADRRAPVTSGTSGRSARLAQSTQKQPPCSGNMGRPTGLPHHTCSKTHHQMRNGVHSLLAQPVSPSPQVTRSKRFATRGAVDRHRCERT